MRRFSFVAGLLAAGSLAVAACGGSSTPTVPPVNVPSLAIPSIAIPSIAIPSIAIPSIAIPSLGLGSFALPSFTTDADPALAAKFPTTINGTPVTGVETVNFLQFYQQLGSSDPETQANVTKLVQILQGGGIDPTTFAFGSGTVALDTGTEQLLAYHVPGSSAATLLTLFPQLAAISNQDETPPTISTATVGGKTVTTVDDGSGSIDYLYPSGDVLWGVSTDQPDNAAAILAAIQ